MLYIKGKLIRTPLTTIVKFKNELDLLKASLNILGAEYTIEDYVKKDKSTVELIREEEVIEEEIIKTKKKSVPKTTLEKMADESE